MGHLLNIHRSFALAVCLGVVGLLGCSEVTPDRSGTYPAQRALIGKTKQALLACAGNPLSESTKGDLVMVLYYKEASLLEESFPGSKSSFAKVHHGCRATIFLREDRISDVRYESVPGTHRDEDHCEEIFVSCVGP
jgi:hypothetical protein